ncbi:hypothetical protein L2E82_45583 [Cichorium intybus]|uniref:Uncharacterized protein n=1 Tax=Cichorium intybus TaxID=13427 RepID=A0ACB8ZSE6_CICIN|nr:hypothetical protein L2E82_45583 [Cichorium intybus]
MFRVNHDFLQFPEGPAASAEYRSRRDALTGHRVLEATVIDRAILGEAGLWGEIEPFLHRTWTHRDASFTCRGWDRIMATDEDVVYTELLLEFLSTIEYTPKATDPQARLIRFRLGGEHRECSLREFARDLPGEPPPRSTPPPHAPHRLHLHHAAGGGREGVQGGHDVFLGSPRPLQFVRAPTEPPQAPQPAYAQPDRRRRRAAAPEPAPVEPQPQEDSAAIHRLEVRLTRMEDQLEWIGEVLSELAAQQGRCPRPFPARAHDHEAGSSRPPGGS